MLLIIEPQALIRKSNGINVKNKKRAGNKKTTAKKTISKRESKTSDE